jgi:hypothetical protein
MNGTFSLLKLWRDKAGPQRPSVRPLQLESMQRRAVLPTTSIADDPAKDAAGPTLAMASGSTRPRLATKAIHALRPLVC